MWVMMEEVSSGRRGPEGVPWAMAVTPLWRLRRRAHENRCPPEITGRRTKSPFSLDHNLSRQNHQE